MAESIALAPPPAAGSMLAENYRFLTDYVYRESGIVLDENKRYLVDSRLTPLLQESSLPSLDALCILLRTQAPGPLQRKVIEAMTTHETFFFRDLVPFDALREHVLPPLIEKRQSARKLSFWSAAASSGQEAYSLAMMLLEMGLGAWDIQILGTDLSAAILEKAREAQYSQSEVNRGLPAGHLVRYFERNRMQWRLRDEVRRMVTFEKFDLRRRLLGRGPFDVIFCRNCLIYFDVETKKQILRELRRMLVPGGYLILGSAETTLNLDESFERVPLGKAVLYRAS